MVGFFRNRSIAELVLSAVLVVTAINLGVDALAEALGGRSATVFDLSKRYSDFFHFALSFPPHGPVASALVESGQVTAAVQRNDYDPNSSWGITNLHVPPLTALLSIAASAAMRSGDPSLLFFGLVAALGAWWMLLVRRYAPTTDRWVLTLLGLLAYPTLMMVTRGNLYAGLCALLLIHAMLLSARRQAPLQAGVLLAIAMCIRPNAVLFIVPLLLLQPRWRSAAAALVISWSTVSVVAYLIASAVYPDYTIAAMLDALTLYHQKYAVLNGGLAYGSSLLGGAKMVFGYHPLLELGGALTGLACVGASLLLHLLRPLAPAILLFLVLAGYTLGSAVFADYHLMAFLLLPIVIAWMGRLDRSTLIVLLAATSMLLPKHIHLRNGVTTQVGLNPLLLLLAVAAVVFLEANSRLRTLRSARDDLRPA